MPKTKSTTCTDKEKVFLVPMINDTTTTCCLPPDAFHSCRQDDSAVIVILLLYVASLPFNCLPLSLYSKASDTVLPCHLLAVFACDSERHDRGGGWQAKDRTDEYSKSQIDLKIEQLPQIPIRGDKREYLKKSKSSP